ncbi:MAG: protein phosphatase 2C domain-containing protein [Bacteroidales bacterium]|jgi:serine/threonine protein phosphatase PrpC|nr:protein phosphatase 2C domain-containing protein [Bacteroidales bacterium]
MKMYSEKTEIDTIPEDWIQGQKNEAAISTTSTRLVIGEEKGAVIEIPRMAKQPNKISHRSDWISDIAQIDDLTIMATSMRGSLHYGLETVRQDAYAIGSEVDLNEDNWLIASIADGVSSSKRPHAFADYMVRQTILVVADNLRNNKMSFENDFWNNLSKQLVEISIAYCKNAARSIIQSNIDIEKIDLSTFADQWAATLEYVIVQTKKTPESKKRKFVHVSVAGDGSAYILNENRGWKVVKTGKERKGEVVSNAVSPLPFKPETFSIQSGELCSGDCLLLVTDGLGDIIRNGNTLIGGFFQKAFPKCETLVQFLMYSSVAFREANDDRTVVLIK